MPPLFRFCSEKRKTRAGHATLPDLRDIATAQFLNGSEASNDFFVQSRAQASMPQILMEACWFAPVGAHCRQDACAPIMRSNMLTEIPAWNIFPATLPCFHPDNLDSLMATQTHSVTEMLQEWSGSGDREALDKLMPIVYDELRRQASRSFNTSARAIRYRRRRWSTRPTCD